MPDEPVKLSSGERVPPTPPRQAGADHAAPGPRGPTGDTQRVPALFNNTARTSKQDSKWGGRLRGKH